MSSNYWDYKNLIEMGFGLLVPIVAYSATNEEMTQRILSFFVKYTMPLFLVFVPFLSIDGWGWYFFPISFLMLFYPALNFRVKVLIVLVTLVATLADVTSRSHLFKYGIPIILLMFFRLRHWEFTTSVMKVTHWVFIAAPWFFFFLGVSGVFNIFKVDEYIKGVKDDSNIDRQ